MAGKPRLRFWPRPGAFRRTGGLRWLPAALGIVLALEVIALAEGTLRPQIARLARAQAERSVTEIVNDAVAATLAEDGASYGTLVTLQRDEAGALAAVTTSAAGLNALRTEILGRVLRQVNELYNEELAIPLGNLTGIAALFGRGSALRVRAMSAAAPSAEFRSSFTAAGVNQTLHRVMMDVDVRLSLLLPGQNLDVDITVPVCLAETVIVGETPEIWLWGAGNMND